MPDHESTIPQSAPVETWDPLDPMGAETKGSAYALPMAKGNEVPVPKKTLPQYPSLEDIEDRIEAAHEEGRKAAASELVRALLRDLCGDDRDRAALFLEVAEARRVLRRLCEDHGDNDWDDNLHLADVIDKHLGEYLEAS